MQSGIRHGGDEHPDACSPTSTVSILTGTGFTVLVDDTPNGTVDIVNGEAVYTPKPNFAGTDPMLFAAEDEFGLVGDDAPMTITVTAPRPPPTRRAAARRRAPKDTVAPVGDAEAPRRPRSRRASR